MALEMTFEKFYLLLAPLLPPLQLLQADILKGQLDSIFL